MQFKNRLPVSSCFLSGKTSVASLEMSVSSCKYHGSSNFGINYKKNLISLHLTNQSKFLRYNDPKNRANSDHSTIFGNCIILNMSNPEDVLDLSVQVIVVPMLLKKISIKLWSFGPWKVFTICCTVCRCP